MWIIVGSLLEPFINLHAASVRPGEQTMAKYRPEMKKYYYDPTKYGSYLEQLGIKYPTVR